MWVKALVPRGQAALHRLGLHLGRYRWTYPARRQQILRSLGVDVVLDVGANTGQYGAALRANGYAGDIYSFEPLADAYAQLERRRAQDPRWHATRCALGRTEGELTLNVSESSIFSSALPIAHDALSGHPSAAYVRTESVPMHTLDSLADQTIPNGRTAALKLDVQGFEREVLAAGTEVLRRVRFLEVELSPVAIYEGQPIMTEMLTWLEERGLILSLVENLLADEASGRALQFNGIFVKRP